MDVRLAKSLMKRKLGSEDENHRELKRLEKLVFGDPSHLFEEEQSPAEKHKKFYDSSPDLNAFVKDETFSDDDDDDELKPAWEDEDDVKLKSAWEDEDDVKLKPAWEDEDDLCTSIKTAHELQGRPDNEHTGKPTDRYDTLLKRRFESIVGNPTWAKLKTEKSLESGSTDDEEDDNDDSVLQRCGNFIKKNKNLSSGIIKFNKLKALNCATQREGKFIRAIEFHPTSSVALVTGSSGIATLFDVNGKTNPKIQMVRFPNFDIHCARFTHDGDQFIVGSQTHRHYYSYDMLSGRSTFVPAHHETGITNMANFEISPNGKILAVCGRFGIIYLISVKTKEWLGSLKMNGDVNAISFNSDGSQLFSHGEDGYVYIWDMKSRTCVHKFSDDGCLKGTSICVSPNDKILACGSSSGIVNLYDTQTLMLSDNPQPLKILNNLTTECTTLKFNHSSEILAAASVKKNRAIRLMYYPSLSVYQNFPPQNENTGLIKCVSFSPHSGYLAIGSNFGKALLYRLNYFGSY